MPLETPSDGLDLTAMRAADAAVESAAARARTAALRERLSPQLTALPLPMRQVLDRLIEEIGRVDAGAEAARQAALEARRSRGDWLQIDPLRHIPEDRGTAPPAPPARYEIHADDLDFLGFGWHAAEGRRHDSWRWSGDAPAASVIVPDLGAGTLAIEMDVELPFGVPFRPELLTVLANGEPLALTVTRLDGSRATLSATWDGFEATGANLGLVLLGPLHGDPHGRDTRQLGIGIRRVSAERLTG